MGFKEEMSVPGTYVIYLLIALDFLVTAHTKQFYQLIAAFALFYAVVLPIRITFFKNRPKKEPHHNWLSKFTANSLISIHSGRSLMLASVIIAYFSYKPAVMALGIAAVGMTCLSRYLLGKHQPIDIAAGLLAGFLIAAVVLTFV